jgi:hypothetical protein
MAKQKRTRRTHEQMIADLQAKIESLKKRQVVKKAKRSPALKNTVDAVRAIDMALAANPESPLKKSLSEAREPLVAFLQLEGIPMPKRRGRKPGTVVARGSRRKAVAVREEEAATV